MRPSPSSRSASAFTATELMVVIVLLLVLGAVTIYSTRPAAGRSKHGPGHARIRCAHNLKQIGLAYKIFANDNDDKFPFLVTGSLADGNMTQAWLHFQAMSNELGSAKILSCPFDRYGGPREMAIDFGQGASATSNSLSTVGNGAVSYFASLDAGEILPESFAAGDHRFETNRWNIDGRLFLSVSNRTVSWTTNIHDRGPGNVTQADGSVQQLTSVGLAAAVRRQGIATNRLLLPLLP